jgi:hypothetical protein
MSSPKIVLLISLAAGLLSGLVILSAKSNPVKIYEIGDEIVTDTYSLRVLSSAIAVVGDAEKQQSDFALVNLEITNTGSEAIPFIPVFQTAIRTGDGRRVEMSPYFELENPISAGPIEPGASLQGTLSYLLPADTDKLFLLFEPSWQESDQLIIALQ